MSIPSYFLLISFRSKEKENFQRYYWLFIGKKYLKKNEREGEKRN